MTTTRHKARPSWMEREAERKQRNNARAEARFPQEPPANMAARRVMTARFIAMRIGNARRAWRACPDTACRRARACLTLSVLCGNPLPVDPGREQLDRALALERQAEMIKAEMLEAKTSEAQPSSPRGRRKG